MADASVTSGPAPVTDQAEKDAEEALRRRLAEEEAERQQQAGKAEEEKERDEEIETAGDKPVTPEQAYQNWRRIADRHGVEASLSAKGVHIDFPDGTRLHDSGSKITLTSGTMTDAKADAVMAAAKEHGWQSVQLSGDDASKRTLAAAAVRAGIPVTNPELQDLVKTLQKAQQQEQAKPADKTGPAVSQGSQKDRQRDAITAKLAEWKAEGREHPGDMFPWKYANYREVMHEPSATIAMREAAKVEMLAAALDAKKRGLSWNHGPADELDKGVAQALGKWGKEAEKIMSTAADNAAKVREFSAEDKDPTRFKEALAGYQAAMADPSSSHQVRDSLRNAVYDRAQAIGSDPNALAAAKAAGVGNEVEKYAGMADRARAEVSAGPSMRI